MLKTIHRTDQVAMDQVARVPIISGIYACFRRCLDEKIDWSDGREIIALRNLIESVGISAEELRA
jgi:hypothetical protein